MSLVAFSDCVVVATPVQRGETLSRNISTKVLQGEVETQALEVATCDGQIFQLSEGFCLDGNWYCLGQADLLYVVDTLNGAMKDYIRRRMWVQWPACIAWIACLTFFIMGLLRREVAWVIGWLPFLLCCICLSPGPSGRSLASVFRPSSMAEYLKALDFTIGKINERYALCRAEFTVKMRGTQMILEIHETGPILLGRVVSEDKESNAKGQEMEEEEMEAKITEGQKKAEEEEVPLDVAQAPAGHGGFTFYAV